MVRRGNFRRQAAPIARDGWRFILPPLGLSLVCGALGWVPAAAVLLLLAAVVALFFRDPERRPPRQPGLLLSPADGKVISIDEVDVETGDGRRERLRRVGIFLSIFNAHIQRSPTYGTVVSVEHNPGRFINALKDKASEENEHNMIWMRTRIGAVGVKQIAGVIARRVVCYSRPNDHLLAGQRLGLIRFGSRAEAYFPLEARVRIEVGRKVKAGLSILAEATTNVSRGAR
ncbi:MAG TPA: phosphatidylserine decarboxylase [Sumerlaeia bacterium]|nr:phosphatidylserine decarboxylase [Sumerlaeia bacterium]